MGGLMLVLLIVAVLLGLVWLGYWLAEQDLTNERDELDTRRQVLDVEWTALENTRRVHDVFWQARDDLRRAEQAHRPPPKFKPEVIDGEWE
jgi:hypothetical protein